MKILLTSLPGVLILEPKVYEDERGYFMETYQTKRFEEAGIPHTFVQDNHSRSKQGALRGLHYQLRHPQGKLVRVVSGEIYDVAVDLRSQSPTFGKWVGERLSSENRRIMWIPPGFAHGFYTLSETTDVTYKVTDFYAPQWDRTLLWDDPKVAIAWPLLDGVPLLISKKDRAGKHLKDADTYEDMILIGGHE